MNDSVRRHFVSVAGRQVLVRTAGTGHPIVLLHDVPGTSETLLEAMGELAVRALVIAPDLPGHGLSQDPSTPADLREISRMLWSAIAAWASTPVDIVGIGASGILAGFMALTKPGSVSAVRTAGTPLHEDDRRRLTDLLPLSIAPRGDGGHLLCAWTHLRHRDWLRSQQSGDRAPAEPGSQALPSSQATHVATVDIFRSPHPDRLARALLEVDATELFSTVAHQTPTAHRAWDRALRQASSCLPSEPSTEDKVNPAATSMGSSTTLTDGRMLIDTFAGQVHVRGRNGPGATPLLMLHQSPGSAASLHHLIEAFATTRTVLAPDTMGNGDSDRPQHHHSTLSMSFYADVLASAMDRLGIEQVDVFGSHTGSLIGLEFAIRHPNRVRKLGLDGITMFTQTRVQTILDRYFPSLVPDQHGSHLVRAWQLSMDMSLFFPWFDQVRGAELATSWPTAEATHPRVVDLLTTGETWHQSYSAAFRYPTTQSLALLQVPTLLAPVSTDVLETFSGPAAALSPMVTLDHSYGYTNPENAAATAKLYGQFFDER